MKARQKNIIFKLVKKKGINLIVCLTKLSFNKENKNILTYMKRDFTINKPALKELLKDLMKMLNTEENQRLKCRHG